MGELRGLVTDYDGTLARGGAVDRETAAALERWKTAGGKLILATGRQTADLLSVFGGARRFDLIVAENGPVLYDPATDSEELLAPAPPAAVWKRLRELGVTPLDRGRVVIATARSQEPLVARALGDTGVDLRIILNRDSLMVLPPGAGKAAGTLAAAARLGLQPEELAGIGDAENDLELLAACGVAAAVADAVPEVRERAALVVADVGALIARLLGRP